MATKRALIALSLLSLMFLAGSPAPSHAGAAPDQQSVLACGTATTCQVTLNPVVYGDLMVVTASETGSGSPTPVISDSAGLSFKNGSSATGGTGNPNAYIWYATVLTNSSQGISQDTVTVSWTASVSVGSVIVVYLFSGLFTDFTTSKGGRFDVTPSTSLALASGVSFSGYTWACVGAAATDATTGIVWTAGTDFIIASSSLLTGNSEYSTSAASPTTFPMTISASYTYALAGVCFQRSHVSPANVYLLDSAHSSAGAQSVFDINQYQSSFVQVGFSGSAPANYPTTVPEVHTALSGSNLLTVWVGTDYYRTLIPSTNNTFWLQTPAQVSAYTITLQDLSGTFGPGASIYLKLGDRVMVSGYLDAQNDLQVWLPQGYYNVEIDEGANTYTTAVSLPPSSGSTVTVQILKYTVTGNCGNACVVSYGAIFSGASTLAVGFNDSTTSTSTLTDKVFVQNRSGTFQVYSKTWTPGTDYGTLVDSISCGSDDCNSTIGYSLHVEITYTNGAGTQTVDFPVSGAGTGPAFPSIPLTIGGWDSVFGTLSAVSAGAFLVLVGGAGVFGALSAKFGVIVAVAMMGFFAWMGWLAVGGGMLAVLASVAVVAFVGYVRTGR